MAPGCPFCPPLSVDPVVANEGAVALPDGFPVSPGHTLIVPRRHVRSFFDLTPEERGDIMHLVVELKGILEDLHRPSGYNVGWNDGPAAGQTVPHAHLHVIPRYEGDLPDPRGGIRWVLPEKADYWREDKQ